ncbi:MAG: hypothetical protein K0B06_04070 [Brevefilum sp.]|nr:hypothetical protein [Brevefilum sp.]
MFWLGFLIGVVVGVCLGAFLIALLTTAAMAEEDLKRSSTHPGESDQQ